jgi:N-acetylglutamate synthase-like GNAT family acetyltransferase
MNDSLTYHFERVSLDYLPLIKRFYKEADYVHQVGRKDEVYCLREPQQHNRIIAAVRLVKNADYLILRSMVVLPEMQKKGIGKYFLQKTTETLQSRTCWCYPFTWLESFYLSAGFKPVIPDNAPVLIHTKYRQYREQGRNILIMCYLPPASASSH